MDNLRAAEQTVNNLRAVRTVDIDTALEHLRENVKFLQDNVDNGEADWDRMQWIIDGFNAIDGSLSKGGFLPADWQNSRWNKAE